MMMNLSYCNLNEIRGESWMMMMMIIIIMVLMIGKLGSRSPLVMGVSRSPAEVAASSVSIQMSHRCIVRVSNSRPSGV